MPRYIDADALYEKFKNGISDTEQEKEFNRVGRCLVRHAPTIDAVPVVHGEWICNPDDKKFSLVCSVCGQVMPFVPEYLPDNPPFCNCGADMRGSEAKE